MTPGQQLTHTLRLVRPLGQGAMGSVWAADHLSLGTQVAVKFMSPAFAQNQSLVERFRREAVAAAQLKSPYVAQVFDHGVASDGSPYIVMELLEGEDLKQRIKRMGPLDLRMVATIVGQVAKALGRAHHLGIVHRDIKPANIFLVEMDGELLAKVLDFGVAKQMGDGGMGATQTGNIVGTPLYMSPEQLLSAKHVDHHADLWSLGVVAYHAITGTVPFRGETLGSLAVTINAGVFKPPSELRPHLPPAIDTWIQKALQRDPAARFASAREMAEEFERALSGTAASTPGAMGRAPLASEIEAAPGGPLGGSAPGRTLAGSANTQASASKARVPLIVVGAAVALVLGIGTLVAFRRPAAEKASPAAESTSVTSALESAAIATAAPPSPSVKVAPETVPSSSISAAAPEPSATAPASSAAPATTTARAATNRPATASSRPATTTTSPTSKPAAKPATEPSGKPSNPDTIGF